MKFYQQLILCILLLFSFTWADDTTSATPTTFSFSTVTTDLYVETSLSEVCDYDSYVDTINGHAYSYMFTITGETTSSGNIFNLVTYRKFTLTWYFTFADDIDAYSLTARYSGIHIDDLAGVVNLEKGQLMFQYDVTVNSAFLVYGLAIGAFCDLEYVNFAFYRDDDTGSEEILNFYTGNLGSSVVSVLNSAACGVFTLDNCPIYYKAMDFSCDDMSSYSSTCIQTAAVTADFDYTDTYTPTQTEPYTTTIVEDTTTFTGIVSYYTTTDENGDIITTITTEIVPGLPSPITTTYLGQDGYSQSGVVEFYTTTDGDGNTITTSSTSAYIHGPITTTYLGQDGYSQSGVVEFYTTTDGDGNTITTSSTSAYIHGPITTTYVGADGDSESGVVEFYTTTDGDGNTITTSSTSAYIRTTRMR